MGTSAPRTSRRRSSARRWRRSTTRWATRLVDVLRLPAVGKEENAVDQLATIILIAHGEEGEEMAIDGAMAFVLDSSEEAIEDLPFWDTHALDPQRFYNMMCWVYGSDPEGYAGMVTEGDLPEERAESCPEEYERAADAWAELLAPYLIDDEDEDEDEPAGGQDAGTPPVPGQAEGKEVTNAESKPFDAFELLVAIVLGLAAIGGAWAGYQSALWGGNQATSYSAATNMLSDASRQITKAEALYTEAVQVANRDADIDLRISMLQVDATLREDAEDEESQLLVARNEMLVKYLLATQLSAQAYSYIGLPEDLDRTENWDELTPEQVAAATSVELGSDYFDTLAADSLADMQAAEAIRDKAEARFSQGRLENYYGDQFSFTGVLYTVCLFLAGIGLVFKTRIRWGFGLMSFVVLVFGTIDLFSNPWTSRRRPRPRPVLRRTMPSPRRVPSRVAKRRSRQLRMRVTDDGGRSTYHRVARLRWARSGLRLAASPHRGGLGDARSPGGSGPARGASGDADRLLDGRACGDGPGIGASGVRRAPGPHRRDGRHSRCCGAFGPARPGPGVVGAASARGCGGRSRRGGRDCPSSRPSDACPIHGCGR